MATKQKHCILLPQLFLIQHLYLLRVCPLEQVKTRILRMLAKTLIRRDAIYLYYGNIIEPAHEIMALFVLRKLILQTRMCHRVYVYKHLYCLAVQAGFYSDAVECWIFCAEGRGFDPRPGQDRRYFSSPVTHAQSSSGARCLILFGSFVYFHTLCMRTAKLWRD